MLMSLIMNLNTEFDFACILESFCSFSDELDYEFATCC